MLGSSVEKRDGRLWWTASCLAPASLRPRSHQGRRTERGGSGREVRRPPRERGGRGARRRGRGAASGTCPGARARPDEATAGELARARGATAAELAGTWQPQPLHGASDLHRWREKMHFCIAVGLLGKMPALLPLLLEGVFHPKNTMPNAFLLLHGVVQVSLNLLNL